ncbi:MAG: hypothetical protein N2450_00485 [bacterium]|nr:hypothetical protein [bacterium]
MSDTLPLFDDIPEKSSPKKKKNFQPIKEEEDQTQKPLEENTTSVNISPVICEHEEVVSTQSSQHQTKPFPEKNGSEVKPEVLPEFFANVWGQARAKKIVKRWIEENRFPHAILLFGPDGIGKQIFAFELAKHLNCAWGPFTACGVCRSCIQMKRLQHPSLFLVFPTRPYSGEIDKREINEDGEIKITRRYSSETEKDIIAAIEATAADPWIPLTVPDAKDVRIISIRFLRQWVQQTKWVGSNKKVAIISQAHKMNEETSNALLKILEEPPDNTLFILLCPAPENVLPTILSRCQPIRLEPLAASLIERELLKIPHTQLRRENPLTKEEAKLIAELSEGNWLRAKEACADDAIISEVKAMNFLRWALTSKERRLLLDEIDKLVKSRKAENIDRLLVRMLYFIRDAIKLQNHQGEGLPEGLLIRDEETIQRLKKFVEGTRGKDLTQAAEYILETQENLIHRNPQPLLLLTQLMYKLNRLLIFGEVN